MDVEPSVDRFLRRNRSSRGLHVITYSARLDVPRELVTHVAGLLRAERRVGGNPARAPDGSDLLLPGVLVWCGSARARTRPPSGRGSGCRRATAYRYVAEAVRGPGGADTDPARRAAPGRRRRLVARHPRRETLRHRPARRDHHQRQRQTDRRLVLRQTPRLRRQHSGDHAPGRATDLDLRRDARAPARPDLRPAPGHHRRPVLGSVQHWTCRPWPTPATKALARASTPRTSSPPTAAASRSTTAPTTCSFDRCAASENAASRSSPAAGGHCATPPPAHAHSATSSAPRSTSPTSNTDTYRNLVEITSLFRGIRLNTVGGGNCRNFRWVVSVLLGAVAAGGFWDNIGCGADGFVQPGGSGRHA